MKPFLTIVLLLPFFAFSQTAITSDQRQNANTYFQASNWKESIKAYHIIAQAEPQNRERCSGDRRNRPLRFDYRRYYFRDLLHPPGDDTELDAYPRRQQKAREHPLQASAQMPS